MGAPLSCRRQCSAHTAVCGYEQPMVGFLPGEEGACPHIQILLDNKEPPVTEESQHLDTVSHPVQMEIQESESD